MTPEEKLTALTMIRYFWENYNDPTRWIGWENAKGEFPSLARAWDNYTDAVRRFTLEVNSED